MIHFSFRRSLGIAGVTKGVGSPEIVTIIITVTTITGIHDHYYHP